MASDWVTGLAALGGTVVGGAITLFGQGLDAGRRRRAEERAALSALVCDVAEGAAALRIGVSPENLHILRSALLKVIIVGDGELVLVSHDWLTMVDLLIADRDHGRYVSESIQLEKRFLAAAQSQEADITRVGKEESEVVTASPPTAR